MRSKTYYLKLFFYEHIRPNYKIISKPELVGLFIHIFNVIDPRTHANYINILENLHMLKPLQHEKWEVKKEDLLK